MPHGFAQSHIRERRLTCVVVVHMCLGLKLIRHMWEVDFIVVDSYSPYTAIVAKPWLHALGAISSTLHQKVQYPFEGLVKEILGNQFVARQCMVVAIMHKLEAVSLDFAKKPL